VLFVGDDWAEDHHDIEVQDENGRRLARARLPEGVAGLARLHELLAEHLDEDGVDSATGFIAQNVVVGSETDRGPWVAALVAAGYRVFAINPMSAARYRNGTPPRGRSPTEETPTCWPRSSGWTATTTARWPVTAPRPRR
jgi:hypothetical protein